MSRIAKIQTPSNPKPEPELEDSSIQGDTDSSQTLETNTEERGRGDDGAGVRDLDDIESELNRSERLVDDDLDDKRQRSSEFTPIGGLVTPRGTHNDWTDFEFKKLEDVTERIAPRLLAPELVEQSNKNSREEEAEQQDYEDQETMEKGSTWASGGLASLWSWVRAYTGTRGEGSSDDKQRTSRR